MRWRGGLAGRGIPPVVALCLTALVVGGCVGPARTRVRAVLARIHCGARYVPLDLDEGGARLRARFADLDAPPPPAREARR